MACRRIIKSVLKGAISPSLFLQYTKFSFLPQMSQQQELFNNRLTRKPFSNQLKLPSNFNPPPLEHSPRSSASLRSVTGRLCTALCLSSPIHIRGESEATHLTRMEPPRKCLSSRTNLRPRTLCSRPSSCLTVGWLTRASSFLT